MPYIERNVRFGDSRLPRLFWKKTHPQENGCWLWSGPRCGVSRYGSYHKRRAHRLAFQQLVGAIPAGLELDHLCRQPMCVNPSHLEPVTHRENVLRGTSFAAVHARKTYCIRGHKFVAGSFYAEANGARRCKECTRMARAERQERAREFKAAQPQVFG